MKITHLCLACFYIDNYTYQENVLPKHHKLMGYEVEIIASLVSFDENGKQILLKTPSSYMNNDGIKVTRLAYGNGLLSRVLRKYKDTIISIKKSEPDILFIHGLQFLDILSVIRFVKNNRNVKIYIDNHSDFSNSARTFISKWILHRIIWRYCAQRTLKYTEKYFGVLPARVDYLKKMYKIPASKIELLLMGADNLILSDALINFDLTNFRSSINVSNNDFLIVTGGKIDQAKKQVLLLMKAINLLDDVYNIKLLVFGSVQNEIKQEFDNLLSEKIVYLGWANDLDSYRYFYAADLVIFPGRHSVYWEQVVAIKKPLIVKYWQGTTHVDIGGNCLFLHEDSIIEVMNIIKKIYDNTLLFESMKNAAKSSLSEAFLYDKIAKKSIDLD